MKKIVIIILLGLTLISVISSLVLNANFLIMQLASPRLLKPNSDVPVTFGIGWQTAQSDLHVDNFTIEVVHAPLNLFNNEALVRFHIYGNLTSSNLHWKPYIQEVNISERLIRNDGYELVGDILITPIVVEDYITKNHVFNTNQTSYSDLFDIKVEKKISTYKWGCNSYIVYLGDKKKQFELFHDKSCSDIGIPGCGASCP